MDMDTKQENSGAPKFKLTRVWRFSRCEECPYYSHGYPAHSWEDPEVGKCSVLMSRVWADWSHIERDETDITDENALMFEDYRNGEATLPNCPFLERSDITVERDAHTMAKPGEMF